MRAVKLVHVHFFPPLTRVIARFDCIHKCVHCAVKLVLSLPLGEMKIPAPTQFPNKIAAPAKTPTVRCIFTGLFTVPHESSSSPGTSCRIKIYHATFSYFSYSAFFDGVRADAWQCD